MLMDQELTTSCTQMLEIKDGQHFPTGAVAQLLTAAARKRATMPYDFGLTYVIDTFAMRRFGVAKGSRLLAWNGTYGELIDLIETMPEEERRFIRVVRDGGGRVEGVQVLMPQMTIWTPLSNLRITGQVRVGIFSEDFEEEDFKEGGAVSAIVYARLGVHGKARSNSKLDFRGGMVTAEVPVWELERVERLQTLAIQRCTDERTLGQTVNGKQITFVLGSDVKDVRNKAIALGLIETRGDGEGEGMAILRATIEALSVQVSATRHAAEVARAADAQVMADMHAGIVRLQEANEALFRKAEASSSALEAMQRAAAVRAKAATGETGETAETKLFGAGERAPRLEDQATPSKLEIDEGGTWGTVATRRTAAMSRKATTAQAGAAARSTFSPLRVHNARRDGVPAVAFRGDASAAPYR